MSKDNLTQDLILLQAVYMDLATDMASSPNTATYQLALSKLDESLKVAEKLRDKIWKKSLTDEAVINFETIKEAHDRLGDRLYSDKVSLYMKVDLAQVLSPGEQDEFSFAEVESFCSNNDNMITGQHDFIIVEKK